MYRTADIAKNKRIDIQFHFIFVPLHQEFDFQRNEESAKRILADYNGIAVFCNSDDV